LTRSFDNEHNEAMGCLAVGIDLGTTNTKVALVSVDATDVRVRAVAAAATPEPSALRDVLTALLRRVLDGEPPPDVVGIASMAETGLPLDRDGGPLGRWLRWDGRRAGSEADRLADRLGWADLVAATGVRPSAKVPLVTWAWLRVHEPDTWAAMAAWAGAADYAGYLITGRLLTDHTLAGRTMAYRLPDAGAPVPDAFDADLLAEVGLRPDQLPEVGGNAPVSDPAFVAAGLSAGTPVVVTGHDHAVGAYACGVREPGEVADSLGTAEAVLSVVAGSPEPVTVARAGMSTAVTVDGRHRAIVAGSPSAGATVRWWLEQHLDPDAFDAVLARGDRPTGVLVLPYLSGRQAPAPDPAARFRVIGAGPAHDPVDLAKAVLEGLCLQARWMLEEQTRLSGRATTPAVTLFGGAVSTSPAWVRIKAQVQPGDLRVVPTVEPVAVGAAVLAAARAGGVGPVVPALPATTVSAPKAYDQMYARFVAAATTHAQEVS
jgi:sugar (pentulose or hexulose) kinase